jgi:hypothetical protein
MVLLVMVLIGDGLGIDLAVDEEEELRCFTSSEVWLLFLVCTGVFVP